MKMTMKKTLVAAAIAAMAMSGAANAAPATGTGTSGSSLIFSAWDANSSFSIDLGTFLNTYLGADTISGSLASGAKATMNAANTLTASNTAYTGSVAADGTIADFALTGFNLSGSSVLWNVAAADSTGRNRLLTSQAGSFAGALNSQVSTATGAVGSYIGLGAANGMAPGNVAGTNALVSTAGAGDAYYANSATWGSDFGGSGIGGNANSLTGTSNLVAVWQQSTTVVGNAGWGNLTAGGNAVTASIIGSGANSVLHFAATPVAAVPEADTYAMFLAGLGLMGFIARRRMQA
jgi:hypothetical protein